MFEVFDVKDSSFLKDYEHYFLDESERTNNQQRALGNMPQYLIDDKPYVEELLKHYVDVFYPDWVRVLHRSYVFKFEPDKATLVPHIDLDPDTCQKIKGYAKRVLIYANPYWDTSWGGGTYFAPYENYKPTKHYTAKVPRRKFAQEAALVDNVPGRVVVFDPNEWHMPQDFSGSTVQRLNYSFLIMHPEFYEMVDTHRDFMTPDNDNGVPVTTLLKNLDPAGDGTHAFFKKNSVTSHVDSTVRDAVIKTIK
jgi:hypothetical protein